MLKKLFMIIAVTFYFGTAIYAGGEIELISEPSSIKVFLRGAELNHHESVNLIAGTNEIVFSNLPDAIDQSSIQVSAIGDAVILSVVKGVNYLKSNVKPLNIIALEDSLRTYKYLLRRKSNEKEVSEVEIDLLLANKVLSGKDKNITVNELKNMDAFFKERLTSLKNGILDFELDIAKLEKNIKRVENQLNELNKMRSLPVNEIIVTVTAKKSVSLKLDLSYVIYSAGWSPKYDIRVKNIEESSELIYNAEVWQNSGLDWNNVEIILSTRDTRQGGNKPELYPWFIDFTRDFGYQRNGGKGMMKRTMELTAAAPEVDNMQAAGTMADYITVNENQLAVEFKPELKYSIPSDGKPHTVMLQKYNVPAEYEYYCAPKVDMDAFLIAYLTDWCDLNLLPGKANIYFENSFVGNTFINPGVAEEKLALSLGRDKNVIVSRKILKDFTEDKFLSNDVERIFAYEFSVRSNKKSSINLLLEDQLPIPQNEDIEVELIDKSGAKHEVKTGRIKWMLKISPNEIVDKKFIYSVRYPKDKQISNLN